MKKKPLFTHFERVYKTKPTGRPKIDWSDKNSSVVKNQATKVWSSKSLSLVKEPWKKIVRGSIRVYGKKVWVHIGTNHKYGKVHTSELIGEMTDEQLRDEFRFKLNQKGIR